VAGREHRPVHVVIEQPHAGITIEAQCTLSCNSKQHMCFSCCGARLSAACRWVCEPLQVVSCAEWQVPCPSCAAHIVRKQGCVPEHASWIVTRLTAPVLVETQRSIKHTGRFAPKRAMLAASPKLSNNAQATRKVQVQSPARMRTQTVAASAGRSSMPASPGQKHACCAQGSCRITPRCPLQ